MQLHLDRSVYTLEAVQKAAYRFIDRLAVVIEQNDKFIELEITFDENHSSDSAVIMVDFKKELLDQNLRQQIKSETESVRNLILAYAFSKSGLQS